MKEENDGYTFDPEFLDRDARLSKFKEIGERLVINLPTLVVDRLALELKGIYEEMTKEQQLSDVFWNEFVGLSMMARDILTVELESLLDDLKKEVEENPSLLDDESELEKTLVLIVINRVLDRVDSDEFEETEDKVDEVLIPHLDFPWQV